jgi:predicted glycogen debranching enzyme
MKHWAMTTRDKTTDDLDTLLDREWLAVNGIGGYACSTVPGMNTRKYHGLLVAAMSPPIRRMVLLSRAEETVVCDGWSSPLGCNEYPGTIFPRGDQALQAFSPVPYPRWAYQGQGWTIEKSLRMLTGRNAVVLTYTLLGGDAGKPVELQLRPVFALRGIHDLMYQWNGHLSVEPRGTGGPGRPPGPGGASHPGDRADAGGVLRARRRL